MLTTDIVTLATRFRASLFAVFRFVGAAGAPEAATVPTRRSEQEVMPPSANWPTASDSAGLDIQVGSSYAPQHGRYQLDFSKVRTTFDETIV